MPKSIFFKRLMISTFLLVFSAFLINAAAYARAGGGGGGMAFGGGSYSFHAYGQGQQIPVWVLVFPASIFLYLLTWYGRRLHKLKSTKRLLKEIARKDGVWDEEKLVTFVKEHFTRTQQAWCSQDLGLLRTLLHPELFAEWQTKISDQVSKGIRDVMENLFIEKVQVVDIKNFRDNTRDQFTAYIKAAANDATYDSQKNLVINKDPGIFEFWTYNRLKDGWVLRHIDAGDKDAKFLKVNINEE